MNKYKLLNESDNKMFILEKHGKVNGHIIKNNTALKPAKSRDHPFNGWFDIAPIRGQLLATPKGVVSQAIVTCNP